MLNKTIYRCLLIAFLFFSSCSIFRSQKEELTIAEVHHYASLSAVSYQENTVIRQEVGENMELKIFPLESVAGKFFVFVDHEKEQQFVVIRGTHNLQNAIDDLRYLRTQDEKLGMLLHDGFRDYASVIYRELETVDFAPLSTSYDTMVIGHSLGGAAAVILGAYLEEQGFNLAFIVTFGQPKVTNEEGAKKLEELPLVRIVNNGDVVTNIPIVTFLTAKNGRFEHSGLEMLLHGDQRIRLDYQGKTDGWDLSLEGQLQAVNPVEKHGIAHYLKKVRELSEVLKGTIIKFDDGFEWKIVTNQSSEQPN